MPCGSLLQPQFPAERGHTATTLPPVQIRHTGSLITDLEAIDKPQILPDQPDQTKMEKTRSDFPKELGFPPFEKTRSISQQPRTNFQPGPELYTARRSIGLWL